MEEKVAVLTKEKACQSEGTTNRIVRFETDLMLAVEKVELAEDSETIAHKESPIIFKHTKETREKYAMVLVLSTTDVEQLRAVRKQLETSRSELAIILHERTNQATPGEIAEPKVVGGLAEKRCNQLQKQVEEMKEAFGNSARQLTEVQKSNADLMSVQAQLQEEVRKARKESQKLQSKMIAAAANHAEELSRYRKYKTQFDGLKVEFEKLVTEKVTSVAVPVVADNKEKQHLIIARNEQVKQHNQNEDISRKIDRLLSPSRDQRRFAGSPMQSAVQIWEQATVVPQTEPRKGVLSQVVPNAITHQKNKQLQVWNFNAIASYILTELHCQGTDLRYDVCTICKSKVETRFHCAKCEYFILCIPCYQKGRHHHKMEILGFDLDIQEPPEGCRDIKEARKSKIDRRISSLLHSFQCCVANCREPYCKSMKLIISHNLSCKLKAAKSITEISLDSRSSCPTCAELVALIIYHAKLCTNPICIVPHCSSAKKKIKNFQNKLLIIQKAEREKHNKEPSSQPMSPFIQHNVNPALIAVPSTESLNWNQLQKRETPNVVMDVGWGAAPPVAPVAPYVAGSTGVTKTGTIRPTLTDAEKRNIVRENIILILHAHECQYGRNQVKYVLLY